MLLMSSSIITRLGLLVTLIVVEALAVSIFFDASLLFRRPEYVGYDWLGHAGSASKILVAWIAALLVALAGRLLYWSEQFCLAVVNHPRLLPLILQLSAFALFLLVTQQVSRESSRWDDSVISLPLVWLVLVALVTATWLVALAPLRFWFRFVGEEALTIAFACAIAAVVWMFTLVTQNLWDPLSTITFNAVASLLQWLYTDLVVEPGQGIIGIDDFLVSIAAVCSGYEGIGLVLIFTGFYLFIFRKDFRFPHCLLLLPLGVTAIWSFNILRIAVLIVIGAEISPELAIGGFHSMAGWIGFVLVTACILLIAHNSNLFSSSPGRSRTRPTNFRMALLIPLVVLLAATMITSALTVSVDWWYPLRVVLTAGALALLWHHYRRISFRISWFAVAIGVLVFLVWLLLASDDPVANSAIAEQFQDQPLSLLIAWLVFRTLGALITVPLAEELAFRGYLFELLGHDRNATNGAPFPWLALIVSTVLFGLLHSAWLAGMLAGVAYGLVRHHRDNVADAFVAHATTNGLLSLYVLTTGKWSMW
jgi:exosortase E/protease (VPEID-CTERM system)